MKAIKFTQLRLPNKTSPYLGNRLYEVYLGNGYVFKSKNVKKCEVFLVQASKDFNLQFHKLNRLYAEIFCIYRNDWFYLDNKYITENKTIADCINNLEFSFNWIIQHSGSPNGNYNIVGKLLVISKNIHTMAEIFSKLNYKKSNMPNYYQANSIMADCIAINDFINNYGK